MLYTSEMAAKALGLKPIGYAYEGESCRCAMCTRPIESGDIADLAKMSQAFSDDMHLMPGQKYLCGWCRVTSKQTVMRMLQRVVITPQGLYSLNKDSHRAWFWIDPPPGPFAVVINHNATGAFHYHWRTPVTLDNRMVWVMLDDQMVMVNRLRVLEALNRAQTVLALYAKHTAAKAEEALQTKESVGKRGRGSKAPETLNTPYKVLMREPYRDAVANHGVLKAEIAELGVRYPEIQDDLKFLNTLNPGELQALSSMLKADPKPAEKPELVTVCDADIDFEPTPEPKRPRKK